MDLGIDVLTPHMNGYEEIRGHKLSCLLVKADNQAPATAAISASPTGWLGKSLHLTEPAFPSFKMRIIGLFHPHGDVG